MQRQYAEKLNDDWRVQRLCALFAFPLAVLSLVAVPGCKTVLPVNECPSPTHSVPLSAAAQWRVPVGSDVRVAEVFFQNPAKHPVTIDAISLGATPLKLPSGSSGTADDGGDGPLWWSVRPSTTLSPGGCVVATIAFAESPRKTLALEWVAGDLTNSAAIPRYAAPPRLVTAMVFPGRDAIAVQTVSGTVSPASLSVGGRSLQFLRLRDGRRGRPDVLVARLPSSVRDGDVVFIRVDFADGTFRLAAAKALAAFPLDVPLATDVEKKALGVGRNVGVFGLSPDVGCIDLARHRTGAYIPRLLADLEKAPPQDGRLHGAHFCTGAVAATFDLYGPIADAAFSGSSTFEKTDDPSLRVALAEREFARARDAARPRPAFWYAGLFRRGGKAYAPAEADAVFWSLLSLGNRGVKLHTWRGGGRTDGLADIPELRDCVRRWTSVLRKRGKELSALIPADSFQAGRLTVRTAWNPLSGMLVFWRTADLAPVGEGAALRVRRPEWLSPSRAEDLAAGGRIPFSADGDALVVDLNPGASFGAVWFSAHRTTLP